MSSAVRLRTMLRRDVDVVQARQAAIALPREQAFDRTDQARVDLIMAEIATNVWRHARSEARQGTSHDGHAALTGAGALPVLHTDGVVDVGPSRIPRARACSDTAAFVLAEWGRPEDGAAIVVRHCEAA